MQRLLVRYVLGAMLIIMGWPTVGHTYDGSSSSLPVLAASGESRYVTLFQKVRIFSGKRSELSSPSHVPVRGHQIEKISSQSIATDRRAVISKEPTER